MRQQSPVQWLHAELSALPLARAPESLQKRVLAELMQRQAQPWWRQSYRGWPLVVQCGFALLALGLMHLTLAWLFDPLSGVIAAAVRTQWLSFLHGLQAITAGVAITGRVGRTLLVMIPTSWSIVLLMTFFSSVLLLSTSGTLVYRTLTRKPE